MLFLGPLYRLIADHFATRINHFPLVRLVLYSMDKTILYLLIWMALRWAWKLLRHRPLHFRHELLVTLFSGYVIMVMMLTVFRDVYYPWQLVFHFDRPLSVINFHPLVETFKLRQGLSQFDFWYQSAGNIAWFMPFGFGLPLVASRKQNLLGVSARGLLLSLVIETLQFLLISGVADIDDVIFNTIGAAAGYLVYKLIWPHGRA
ncbi:VanZ family protein [Lacticaseibacillus yichunensis]|uniref:VanZ family protein n=1 Tax=Lacticaseibacillus yichunensis TaxID=2486015 RepID=A0ABW4CL96_9LACO|nr:VanZ family protein [Lacticaseibacillus yichunensis]